MKFNKKLEKAINEDLEARRAKARFYGIENDKDVADLEKEWAFYSAGRANRVPAEWIARYCEEDAE
ncbi:hypothetical protein DUK53_14495 [Listeria sp. SHR_NRA_18]|uniref:hypothetical protein n=1 Tax=Listeria TaxID=1637 RepID=UPI000F5F604B|nr:MULTISPECIES: hypothetical protein [Listeria]RQW65820.1 hypothetical protein DUK53_14495 [Listeria sp. SHR_NRA_18]WAO22062.1 hypothetical protein OTR81_01850 [Listeria newyorkensis]